MVSSLILPRPLVAKARVCRQVVVGHAGRVGGERLAQESGARGSMTAVWNLGGYFTAEVLNVPLSVVEVNAPMYSPSKPDPGVNLLP